jgi:hypothetical protein
VGFLIVTRSLKAFVASLAIVVALLVAAVPASAKPGNGNGRHGSNNSSTGYTYWCDSTGCYYFFSLS